MIKRELTRRHSWWWRHSSWWRRHHHRLSHCWRCVFSYCNREDEEEVKRLGFDVNLTLFGILRVTGTRYEERVDGDDNKEDTRTHALALQEEEVTTFLLDCVPFEVIKVPNINLFSSKSKRPNTIDSSKDNKTLLNSSINNFISFNRT